MPKQSKSMSAKNITAVKKNSPEALPSVDSHLPAMPKLSPEMEKKLKELKDKLDSFKTKLLEKFGDYIVGITLLPPEKPTGAEGEKEESKKEEQKINLLVVVDDTTSQKMSKDELHQKFSTIVKQIGESTDKNMVPQSILLTDLWMNCYDAKYELNK